MFHRMCWMLCEMEWQCRAKLEIQRKGALDGIRVLELSQIVTAPISVVNLSDRGAKVITVEPI
jgi:crotonobetainyl-CoA:carnitine CoA-transferase CaiB-like acyl-CoA transferase